MSGMMEWRLDNEVHELAFDGAYATEACCGELGASATTGRSKAPVSTRLDTLDRFFWVALSRIWRRIVPTNLSTNGCG
jgi:hypothetical protein